MRFVVPFLLVLAACDMGTVHPEPKRSPPAPTEKASEKFGQAISDGTQQVALVDVAKNPSAYTGKTFTTTGTVTAVCQHRGCWMEIKDDAGEAHIKMAGHSFFVPRTASGKKARVMATLMKGGDDSACAEGHEEKGQGCKAEAEAQLGRPLAKLELVAQGVEIL